jgi:hypothetical protein
MKQSGCKFLPYGFLISLLFDADHGSYMFLRDVDQIHWSSRRYIPEDRTHIHCCKNNKVNSKYCLFSIVV